MKKNFTFLLAIIGLIFAGSVNAHGYHHGGWGGPRFGIGINLGPYPFGPYPYYGAYPYYGVPVAPAPVIVQQTPPIYIEPSQSAGNWYFCESSKTYYPYVKECSEGWKTVSPTPQYF